MWINPSATWKATQARTHAAKKTMKRIRKNEENMAVPLFDLLESQSCFGSMGRDTEAFTRVSPAMLPLLDSGQNLVAGP